MGANQMYEFCIKGVKLPPHEISPTAFLTYYQQEKLDIHIEDNLPPKTEVNWQNGGILDPGISILEAD